MKKDVTRKAVERASQTVLRVLDRLKEDIPLGPDQVQMSPRELQKQTGDLDQASVLRLLQSLGQQASKEMIGRDGSSRNTQPLTDE